MIRKSEDMKIQLHEDMKGGAGVTTVTHYLEKDEITAPVRLCAKLTLPPGASVGTHQHIDEDEIFIIVKGTGLLDDGESETNVSAGDVILTGHEESHSIKNIGDDELEITAIIACYK